MLICYKWLKKELEVGYVMNIFTNFLIDDKEFLKKINEIGNIIKDFFGKEFQQ